jgi:hypothetical protein
MARHFNRTAPSLPPGTAPPSAPSLPPNALRHSSGSTAAAPPNVLPTLTAAEKRARAATGDLSALSPSRTAGNSVVLYCCHLCRCYTVQGNINVYIPFFEKIIDCLFMIGTIYKNAPQERFSFPNKIGHEMSPLHRIPLPHLNNFLPELSLAAPAPSLSGFPW